MKAIILVLMLGLVGCASDDRPVSQPVVDTPFSLWKCFYDFKINGNADYLVIDFSFLQYGQRSVVSQIIYKDGVETQSPLDVMINETGMEFYSDIATVRYLAKGSYMKLYLAEAGVNASDVTCVRGFSQ
jgi:hypothetical protein